MALAAPRRLYNGDTGEHAVKGLRHTLRFVSPGITSVQALTILRNIPTEDENGNPTGYTATWGSAFPDEPGSFMALLRYRPLERVKYDGTDSWIIEADYAQPSLGPFVDGVDETAPDYYEWSLEADEISIGIPVFTRHWLAYTDEGGTVQNRPTWKRQDVSQDTGAVRFKLSFNVPRADLNAEDTMAALAQAGKLHEFGVAGGESGLWLFDKPSFTSRTMDLVAINYSWLSERGNPEIEGNSDRVGLPARAPFETYEVIGSQLVGPPGPDDPPVEITTARYREVDPEGHLSLPLITETAPFPLD